MDLWIRSQDKERLMKPIDFYIEETIDYVNKSSQFDIYALNFANDDIIIGTYKAKERAIEILDEIQSLLQPIIKYKPIVQEEPNTLYPYKNFVKVDNNVEIKELSTFVYQMPEN